MENRQIIKALSVDIEHKGIVSRQFDIHLDVGNMFLPGKIVTGQDHLVIYCRSNCGAVFAVGENQFRLQRGDILLIRPGISYGVVSYGKGEEGYSGFVVSFTDAYVHSVLDQFITETKFRRESILIHTRGTIWENIDRLFAMALEEVSMKSIGWETALMGTSMVLLVQVARVAISDPNANVQLERKDLLTGILSYVEGNLAERITLEDVAKRFFVSASTVTHLFNREMHISFYQYVLHYRLWKAKNLIMEGLPMEKVAAQVGFNDYSAFYRAFKQEFNMSPRQYYKKSLEEGRE